MRPSHLLAAVAALSSVSAAWPDVFDKAHALEEVRNVLYGRQDTSESEAPKSTPSNTDSSKETPAATPTDKEENKSTEKPSGSGSSSGSSTPTGSGKSSKSSGKPKATNFGNDVPAGTIAMITPAPIAGTQYYKIGDWVHLAWNYSSLSVTPSAIDIMATCTANQATYTIAVNQSVQATGEVFWNTSNYQNEHPNSPPLLTEMYTLLIYDSNLTASATAKPGYLAVYNQHTFGMYAKQSYTPWANFTCANCNGAMSALESLTLKTIFVTSTTTIASLLYFSVSFGLF